MPARMPSPHAAARHITPGTGHTKPGSTVQVGLQPSPSALFLSSHSSPEGCSTPSPHTTLSAQASPQSPPSEGTSMTGLLPAVLLALPPFAPDELPPSGELPPPSTPLGLPPT